ncbi:MAG: class II fructose-bisphosphate aldolase [Alphaproteobacteria bacterium]|nr:class II fructose-bisphosphate aldolase [Alphaproteobacteria bacterium]MDE1985886.1 class II fructose-bisphosphate aldolase [Alphaproteobacteria bacterium]MDE2163234.1 class II fructose-bisphosphate aldolase [Alphaproteobacteria bacterium]MDE2265857.1 class II fructose-bisphosphate aldolase [Alphaproteobacteria bacterium]MDE2499907.1 class II fructose-bisphosphate aldolase [Alphaproteobacteria bacterium]
MTKKLRPGVVTGEEYLTLLAACKEGGYALPAVNIVGTNSLNAVLETAAKAKSDVIIQLSNGGARFYAGEGAPDAHRARVLGATSAAQHVHLLAAEYGVCVIMHTDHANRKLVPWVEGLIEKSEEHFKKTGKPLFSSHMLDLSSEPLEQNLDECARVLKRLAPLGMSLEIELGVTGGEEDGIGHELKEGDADADNAHLYTQPKDVLAAYDRLNDIGHFTVAASFGNVHGVYAPGNVKLRPEILKNSQKLISEVRGGGDKPLSLVFHGGSGTATHLIQEAVSYGVFKMNIDTDMQFAFAHAIAGNMEANPRAFKYQVDPDNAKPYKSTYDPRKWLRVGELGVVARLEEAIADLGSKGKSLAAA